MSIDSNDGSTREDADFEFQTKYINVRNYLTSIFSDLFVQYGIVSTNWDTKSIVKSKKREVCLMSFIELTKNIQSNFQRI